MPMNMNDVIDDKYSPEPQRDEVEGGHFSHVKMPDRGLFSSLANARPGGPPGSPPPGGPNKPPPIEQYTKFMGALMGRYDWSKKLGLG
jgi:hypothetical protein